MLQSRDKMRAILLPPWLRLHTQHRYTGLVFGPHRYFKSDYNVKLLTSHVKRNQFRKHHRKVADWFISYANFHYLILSCFICTCCHCLSAPYCIEAFQWWTTLKCLAGLFLFVCFFKNLSVCGYFRDLESILVLRHGRTEMGLCPFQGNMRKASNESKTVCVCCGKVNGFINCVLTPPVRVLTFATSAPD